MRGVNQHPGQNHIDDQPSQAWGPRLGVYMDNRYSAATWASFKASSDHAEKPINNHGYVGVLCQRVDSSTCDLPPPAPPLAPPPVPSLPPATLTSLGCWVDKVREPRLLHTADGHSRRSPRA